MRIVVFFILMALGGGCATIEKPRTLEHVLAYTQSQCTQARIDAVDFFETGLITIDQGDKIMVLADGCKRGVTLLRGSSDVTCVPFRTCDGDTMAQLVALQEQLTALQRLLLEIGQYGK